MRDQDLVTFWLTPEALIRMLGWLMAAQANQ